MANKMSDIAAMLIGVSSDYLGNGVNLETLRMNVNFALGSIDRELESEKQAIESVSESQKPSTSESKLPVGSVSVIEGKLVCDKHDMTLLGTKWVCKSRGCDYHHY